MLTSRRCVSRSVNYLRVLTIYSNSKRQKGFDKVSFTRNRDLPILGVGTGTEKIVKEVNTQIEEGITTLDLS